MRLVVGKKRADELNRLLAHLCELYNAALQERRDAWKVCRKSIGRYGQHKELTQLRSIDQESRSFPLAMQRDAINRVDLAFNGFYRRARLGKQPGYPRFKSASRYDSFTVQIRDFSLRGDALRLSKVGEFRVKTRCKVKGSPVSVTIRRADGKWLAILACDIGEAPPKAPVSRAIGIDVGVTALATLSDGREIANPRWADRQAKAIAWEDDDEKLGVQKVTITALTEQAAIDIEAELPRIKKLLERDWIKEIAE